MPTFLLCCLFCELPNVLMIIMVQVHLGEGNGTPLQYFCWKIPWMEVPGRLQSMGSLRVRHDWATPLSLFTFMHWRRKWQPIQYSCLENPRDGGAWWAAVYGVAQSWTRLKWLSSSSSSSRFTSVQLSRSVVSDSLWPHESQHARPPCPSPMPEVHPNSCTSSWWCHPAISSSVVPFSSCPQSLPASGSFLMCQLFASGGQSLGVSSSHLSFQWAPRTDLL